ncbi:ABC transporter permease [Aeromicrobium ginsengisoli]|nr:ABC transporter permease [Aeromicrobium ginsengisoli]
MNIADTDPDRQSLEMQGSDRWGLIAGKVRSTQSRLPLLQMVTTLLLITYGVVAIPDFASKPSIISMLVTASFVGIASAGQTLVVLIGGLDLSVPAFIAVGSILTADLIGGRGWPVLYAFAVILLISAVLGGTSGFISHRFGVQPLVVTLGTSAIVTGCLTVWTRHGVNGSAPPWLVNFSSAIGHTFGFAVPPVIVFWGAAAIVLTVVLHRTRTGRHLYQTGANPIAARLALVPARRVWVGVFAFSAVSGALLGIILAGFSGSGSITSGNTYLFQSLAAVIVGGTGFGARGDYARTVVGTVLLTVLTTILITEGLAFSIQQIIYGVIILVVVAGYGRDMKVGDRL